jgi:hypothetical protein
VVVATVAAAVAAVAISIIEFGDASGSPSVEPHPVQFADTVTTPAAPSASTPAAVLTDVLGRLDLGSGATADFGVPPHARAAENGTSTQDAHLPDGLIVMVPAAGIGAAAVKPEWEADLLAGAVNDELVAHGLRGLSTLTTSLELPDGSVIPVGSGYGNVVAGQQFDESAPSVLASSIKSGIAAVGLQLARITFEKPEQLAPVIYATTSNPAGWVQRAERDETYRAILGNYRNLEGWYIEVDDSNGKPVWIGSMANRDGDGSSWTRPDLTSRPVAGG